MQVETRSESSALSSLTFEVREFLNSLESFQKLVSKYHFKVRTHSQSALKKFLEFPQAVQSQIIAGFTSYLDFLSECAETGMDLRDDHKLLKAFLAKNSYVYDEEFFDRIHSGQIIEIYNTEQIQIFRNLVFMDLCAYTLLDLLIHDPYELYERSDKIKDYLLGAVSTLTQRPYSTKPLEMAHVPVHLIREKFSDQKLLSLCEFKFIAPLYAWPPRQMAAFIAVEEGRNVPDMASLEGLCFI